MKKRCGAPTASQIGYVHVESNRDLAARGPGTTTTSGFWTVVSQARENRGHNRNRQRAAEGGAGWSVTATEIVGRWVRRHVAQVLLPPSYFIYVLTFQNLINFDQIYIRE
jgi:hypothetical protein